VCQLYRISDADYFSNTVKIISLRIDMQATVKNRNQKHNILSRDSLHKAIGSNNLASYIIQFQIKQGVVRFRKELLRILLHHDIVNDIPSSCAQNLS
jgi:hypothetical protein